MGNAYWFAPRPPEVSHRHPFLVFDCQDQLHFELTVFGKEAAARVEKKTVEDYLIHQLHCIARRHHQGFLLVLKTNQTHQTVKLFLSGLKFFYQIMCQQGYYGSPNPLIDSGSSVIQFLEAQDSEEGASPRMPAR